MSRRANDDTLLAYTDLLAEIVRDLLSIVNRHPDMLKHHIDKATVSFAESALAFQTQLPKP